MQPLPIDPVLPEIIASLRERPSLVLEAPPGAGKTTRVPRAMLDAGFSGEIVVLEPRRLAARLAARRVADELGEALGERVGYRVRFDDVGSPATRIRFVTEGTLTRSLLTSPRLDGVGAVLLDEFHERHLQTDLALALLAKLQRTTRPDLRLVVMSATLDGERIAAGLDAPRVRSEGKRFEVKITHLERPDDRPLEMQVAGAVRQLVRDGLDGHVLVFVPGAREIRRCLSSMGSLAQQEGLELHALHGDLSPEEQDAALRPSARRKVIVATNVAESSVTIDGVAAVVDGGLARVASFSPWTGLPSLRTEKISRASAAQRAGRAGRTREGKCLRLYTRADHDARPEHDAPELQRADLCEALLELASHGLRSADLPWLEAPPAPAVEAGLELLRRLDALDAAGAITPLGRSMLRFPLHPRLARLVVEAERVGLGRKGCKLAALLAERDIRQQERASFGGRESSRDDESSRSDPLARLDDLERCERDRLSASEMRARGLDAGAVFSALKADKQMARRLQRSRPEDDAFDEEEALCRALLLAFPDRVARRRRPGGRELVLSSGGAAEQAEGSAALSSPFVVVVSAQEEPRGRSARSVSAVEPEWLLDLFPSRIRDERDVSFNAEAERVEVVERLMYDQIALDESKGKADDERSAQVLADAALKRGLPAFVDPPEAAERWLGRARFLASRIAEFPRFDEADLRAHMAELCRGKRSFAELRSADLLGQLTAMLTPDQFKKFHAWAPDQIELPGGRKVRVHYEPAQPPYIESRLQDFFGMRATPTIAGGQVPLVLRMLAPNQRPVQITTDLEGFWARTYPSVRKELGRKYPRHSWPEDPLTAEPPAPRPPRRLRHLDLGPRGPYARGSRLFMAQAVSLATRRRFAVDLGADPEHLDEQLERLLRLHPTGVVERQAPFGFSFRREPDAFSAIAAGPMLGTSLLLAEYSRKMSFLSPVGMGMSALFFSLAVWFLWRFFRNAQSSLEVVAEEASLVLRSRFGGREVACERFDCRDVVAVLVVQPEGEAPQVLLSGPRHSVLGEVFRSRSLDPEQLAPWMAELCAVVARRASLALRP